MENGDNIMDVKEFWIDVLKQNREKLISYFHKDAVIRWHCSNELFTVSEYIKANCEYPGEWEGKIERIEKTENTIKNFIKTCEEKYGKLDSITLSSTHLPWLSSYFQKIIPEAKLYDPADSLVKAIKNHTSIGSGKIHSIISESEKYPADEFLKISDEFLDLNTSPKINDYFNNLYLEYAR